MVYATKMTTCRIKFEDLNLHIFMQAVFCIYYKLCCAVLHSKSNIEIGAKAGSWTGSRIVYLCSALSKLIYFAKNQGKLDSVQH